MNSKLVYLFTLAVVAATQAHAISLFNGTDTVDAIISTRDVSAAEVSYDCKGSSRCNHLSVGQCDAAFRTINPGNTYATNGAAGNTGVCNGNCGIFVQGSNCAYSGSNMQNAYNNLRANGCRVCGSEHEDNGCLITINFVTGC